MRKKVAIKRSSNNSEMTKKKKIFLVSVAVVLLIAVTLSVVLPIALKKPKDVPFKIPALALPIEEQYALHKFKLNELDNTVTTIRADTMNVTKRGVKRELGTKVFDDTYKLTYGTDSISIDFMGHYPSPSHGFSGNSADYLEEAKKMFPSDSDAIALQKYSFFYKYMLMSQGYNEVFDLQKLSQSLVDGSKEEYAKNLYKHPAADAQYGEVLGENNAVVKEITLDTIYRSLHATGLYMPAGEVVTVKVEGLKEGEHISMVIGRQNSLAWRGEAASQGTNTTGKDNFFFNADIITARGGFSDANKFSYSETGDVIGHKFIQSQWGRQNGRMPWLTAEFTFNQNGTYYIGTPYGGIMHIGMGNTYSKVKTTISGAVETPHYILGVTTPDYFETYLKDAPGVVGVMDTENGQLIGLTGEAGTELYMRQIKKEDVQKLAMLWHSFFAVNESFTGGTYNRGNIVMFDWHVPAGAAVALGGYTYACPTSWFNNAMNYRGLLTAGQWGILHEVGHSHGAAYGSIWGFGTAREGEVRNNALTLLSYILFCDVGTTIRMGGGAEHGGYANPYSTLSETLKFPSQNHKDFDDGTFGYFQCLGMYSNIMHSFGAEKYYELLYTYKNNPNFVTVNTAGLNETDRNRKLALAKRADFAYRCSTVFGMDFRKYFNTFYAANIDNSMFTKEQLSEMNKLPKYEPISCFYAGGIDGVKTSGDYVVAYGDDIVFDLLEKTISSLDKDGKKGFEILSGAKATHGKIKELENGKIAYSFNPKYFGNCDEIKFKVKLSDGVVHEFTIYLRINYNSTKLSTYSDIEPISGNYWDAVDEIINTKTPTISSNPYSYIPTYKTAKGWEIKVSEFYWKAPRTGEVNFSFKLDDGLRFYFGENFNSLEDQGYYSSYSSSWVKHSKAFKVEAGKYYAIKLVNVNKGGNGSAAIGYNYSGENTQNIAIADVFNPNYPHGEYHEDYNPKKTNIETFVFEPSYLVSKKDGISVSTTGTDKGRWQVLKASKVSDTKNEKDYINGNRITTITRTEVVRDENGNPVMRPDGTFETQNFTLEVDQWSYLVDGDLSNYLHTVYGKYPAESFASEADPFEFIIDTGREQSFNYFKVITRTGALGVSKITKYELQISSDGNTYTTISKGDELAYKNNIATLKFDTVTGRYFRLLVKDTTGNAGKFVVIAELDAGIESKTQRLIPSTSSLLFTTKHWKNSSDISSEQSGFMIAERKRQKMVVRFNGENLALYAAVGKDFGMADIKLDGKYYTTIDFSSDIAESRKLMLNLENLEDETHTLEIITKSSGRVMIYMLGINYTSELVNAPNIYLERGLTISLIVFVLLFAALLAFVLCLLFIPKFRKLMGGNRAIAALDVHMEKRSEKIKAKRAEKKRQKEEQATIEKYKSADVGVKQKPISTSQSKVAIKKQVPNKPEVKTKPEAVKKSAEKPAEKSQVKPINKPAEKPKNNSAENSKAKPAASKQLPKEPAKPAKTSNVKSAKPEAKKTTTTAKPASKPAQTKTSAASKSAKTAAKNTKK